MGYRRCGTARVQRRNVPMRRTSREVHNKEVVWMVRQAIRLGILGKDGKELEVMEEQETGKKEDDEDDPRRRRS